MPELIWKVFQYENSVDITDLNKKVCGKYSFHRQTLEKFNLFQIFCDFVKGLDVRTHKILENSLPPFFRSAFLTDFKFRSENPSARLFCRYF